MNGKNELRNKAKEIRRNLDMEKVSAKLCGEIRKSGVYKASKNIMLFYPKPNEVDLRELFGDDKNFYLPRVCGENLDVCPYKVGDDLKRSEFGVFEPTSAKTDSLVLDLIIVPALASDKKGYRLGYGKGYYDRFLNGNCDIKTLCALPKELVFDDLPHDDYDVKIDYIITA